MKKEFKIKPSFKQQQNDTYDTDWASYQRFACFDEMTSVDAAAAAVVSSAQTAAESAQRNYRPAGRPPLRESEGLQPK